MNIIKKIFLFSFVFLIHSCKKVGFEPKLLWTSKLEKPINSIYPIAYKDNIIVSNYNLSENQTHLLSINPLNGQVKWDIKLALNLYYNLKPYIYKNTLVIPADKTLVAINVDTGEILWRVNYYDNAENFLEGNEKSILRTYYDYEHKRTLILTISIVNGQLEKEIIIKNIVGFDSYYRSPIFYNHSHLSYLIYTSISQNKINRQTNALLNIINYQTGQAVFLDSIYLQNKFGYGVTKQPLISDNNLFLVAYDEIVCFDLLTLCYKWRHRMPRDMLTSQLLITESYVFYACEDGFLRKISKQNGQIIWQTEISGTPSKLFISQNFIHVIGGGNGVWYVVKHDNGQIVKQIKPNFNSDKNFGRAFLIDSKNSKALLNDGHFYYYYDIE